MRADNLLSEVALAERTYPQDELVAWACDAACKAYVRLFCAGSRADYLEGWSEFRSSIQRVRFAVEMHPFGV